MLLCYIIFGDYMNETKTINKDVETLVNQADILISNTIRKINYELINMYFNLGKMIAEYKRDNNSKYGDQVVKRFSEELYIKYGTGFNRNNIFRSIQFYKIFSKIPLGGQFNNINWSHIRELLKFKDINIIQFYLNEIEKKKLTKNELIINIKSKSYERTISNQKSNINKNIENTLKDPIILNIKDKKRSEKELEEEIISNIFNFMKQIGDNIFLKDRQYKINNNGLIYKIDLVLYDKTNNNYILTNLKINKVTRKDISQMMFYVEYFNKYEKDESDNNSIGLILVETKDMRVETNENIYQIKYLNEIPKEKELLKIINENKVILLKLESLKIYNN